MHKFPPSELVLNENNSVFHLHLHPKDLAKNIILVGDINRVEQVSSFFDEISCRVQNREFKSVTGIYKNLPISVISTGIGTDNIDIVLNELDILANINLETRQIKEEKTQLNIIRIGTCGLLDEALSVGTAVISNAAIGFDNLLHFYHYESTPEERELHQNFKEHLLINSIRMPFYAFAQKGNLLAGLLNELSSGITVTLPGFYAPQGRTLRYQSNYPDLPNILVQYREKIPILNFEMEASGIFGISAVLGHNCATVCLGLANRITGEFLKDYKQPMMLLIEKVLNQIVEKQGVGKMN